MALLVLLSLGAFVLADRSASWQLRALVFDGYQRLEPRVMTRVTARVIDVDEASLAALGQWPWPRHRLARLVEATASLGALAVGLDILMSEPGRFSPGALLADHPTLDSELKARLAAIPSNDVLLGQALARHRTVVARVGRRGGEVPRRRGTVRLPPLVTEGGDPGPHLIGFEFAQLNVPEIEQGASGHGLVNSILGRDGVVRRVPMLARVGGEVAPSLALELLRVATGVPFLAVRTGAAGVLGVSLGDAFLPLDPDGAITLHFAPSDPRRRISALDVLEGRVAEAALQGQVAIIGVSALGTTDAPPTPISGRMDGVEIQAQIVESLLDGARLVRPPRGPLMEAAALLLAGGLLLVLMPRLGIWRGLALLGVLMAGLWGSAFVAFTSRSWLLDPTLPVAGTLAVYMVMLGSLLAQQTRRARALNAALERERIASARLAGELGAARDIQMGILPDPAAIAGLPDSIRLAASLEPARSVGGDLYDAFMVDETRLFFAVGDVSGKGIPASLFMALSKTLCKSIVMRAGGSLADRLSIANAEIARENPELLFVTVAAGLLDTRSGELELCVAGHDAPWVLRAGAPPRELDSVGGPPLCVFEDFDYPTERFQLRPGETLVLATDGVTEAMDPAGALYGRQRLAGQLEGLARTEGGLEPRRVVDALLEDVHRFSAGAEPADDVTVLALRYSESARSG